MEYKTYKSSQCNIHTIQTKKFNNACIQIVFQDEYEENSVTDNNFLTNLMSYCSNEYPSRRLLCKKMENLYCTEISIYNMRVGKKNLTFFSVDFLDPKYCYNNFLDDVLDFFFSFIQKPIFENKKYEKNFDIIKTKMKFDIESEMENPNHKAIIRSHQIFDKTLPTSHSSLGTIERLDSIEKKDLIDLYNKIIHKSNCEIFVIGNLDMEETCKKISSKFNLFPTRTKLDNYFSNRKDLNDKILNIDEKGEYEQDIFVSVCDIKNLNEFERNYTMNVFNNIFASGGLTSKLYKYLREDNSLCYNIKSIYQKYDNVLSIVVGFDSKNKSKCIELINKALEEMIKGNFSEEDLNSAKKNILTSIELGKDSISSTLTNYVFNIIENNDLFDTKQNKYSCITKEQIMKVAEKIEPKVYYVLKGDKDGTNNN